MAKPTIQQQAYLQALGFEQANWGSDGPDYGSVSYGAIPPEHVIYDTQHAFQAGVVDEYRIRSYYPPTRELVDLTPYVETVSYTEAEGQAGVQGTLTFVDLSRPGALLDWRKRNSLRSHLARPGLIFIFETAQRGKPLTERQRWVNWAPTVGGPGTDTLQFYDHLVYLANAQASFGYVQGGHHKKGWTAAEVTADICKRYSIPVASLVRTTYRIPYFIFTGSIYDAIATAYAFERHVTGKYFYITTDRGKLVVRRAQSITHDSKLVFLLDPKSNVREPMTFTRSLDQYAGGVIPTGTDQAGNPAYITSGNVDPNAALPQGGVADQQTPVPGLTAKQVAGASGAHRAITGLQHDNQLAAGALFGTLAYNARLASIRDPGYSKKAAQLLSNRLARASKQLEVTADGNVLLRQGQRVHALGYPLDLFVSSITQTLSRADHQMQLSIAWREFEVSDMTDFHAVQQAGAQYAQAQAAANAPVGGATSNASNGNNSGGTSSQSLGGGWVQIGATEDGWQQYGISETQFAHNQAGGASNYNGGFSYAELGATPGYPNYVGGIIAKALGVPGGQYGLPYGFPLWVRAVGGSKAYKIVKSDIGSGQAGDLHYGVDLHPEVAQAISFSGKQDIEIKAA